MHQQQQQEPTDRREQFVRNWLVENGEDPDDLISDAGHTVLDGWMERLHRQQEPWK